jgi:hypothetical protein
MTRRRWTEEEVDWLRLCYPHMHTSKVASVVGRTIEQCYQKAAGLGLVKTPEYLASDDACRVSASRRTPAMQATQFKPGQTSWNKGKKGLTGTQENCRATQFKPGQMPRNWVPIGSHRVNGDGYLDRKVSDDRGGPRDWVAVHRLVWMEANGPVPDGHVVVFKPGRRTNVLEQITADAVELVSRVELMKRNTVHARYPKEVVQLVQLKGAIKRQVNRLAKESQ